MSKIHMFDMTLGRSKAPRTGTIRCAYHVDMRKSKADVAPTTLRFPRVGPIGGDLVVEFGTNSALTPEAHPAFRGGASTTFTIPEDYIGDLNNKDLPGPLRDLFPPNGITLGGSAKVKIGPSGWVINDPPYQHTIVNPGSGALEVVGEIDEMEDVHIGTWDIAEVMVEVNITENDSTAKIEGKVDRLYRRIERVANRAYSEKYRSYGRTRNPGEVM